MWFFLSILASCFQEDVVAITVQQDGSVIVTADMIDNELKLQKNKLPTLRDDMPYLGMNRCFECQCFSEL